MRLNMRFHSMEIGPRLLVALLRLLQHLPMPALVAVGRGVGALLHRFGQRRRRIALRNLELCFPHQSPAERAAVVREHFALLGRSLVERALLWYAPVERLRGLIQVEGDIHLAERSPRPVMWLVPHFLGLEVAGAAVRSARRIHQVLAGTVRSAWAVRRVQAMRVVLLLLRLPKWVTV